MKPNLSLLKLATTLAALGTSAVVGCASDSKPSNEPANATPTATSPAASSSAGSMSCGNHPDGSCSASMKK